MALIFAKVTASPPLPPAKGAIKAAVVPASGCVFQSGAAAAFCDTFDSPMGTGNRSGDLNGNIWGTARATGNQNFASPANGWSTSSLNPCSEGATAPPHDVQVCNGQLHTSVNDGGNVTVLTMYPKQPFDFAGRTGAVVFDVSNDTQGNHAAWPELWVTDQPIPAPFAHEGTFQSNPRNGFGVRFAGCSSGTCPRGGGSVGVDSAIVVTNYVENDSFNGGSLRVTTLDSVTKSGPGQMNHYEVDVSSGRIDVYGTDAFLPGTPMPPLRHIASISIALPLTRGLVYLEDAHYNGNKFNQQGNHTFTWDNMGFDGLVYPQDRTFDVLDHASPNLGYETGPNSTIHLSTLPVDSTSLGNATGAVLLFNHYLQTDPVTFHFTINGHAYTQPWPYPYNKGYSPQALAVPINLADVQTGVNTVTFTTGSYAMTVFNVDIGLIGGGGVPPPITTTVPPPTTTTVPPTTTTQPSTTTTQAPIPISDVPCTITLSGSQMVGTCTGTFQPG